MMQGNPIFMQQAIALATENVISGRGGPFGAVIVRKNEVVATGTNQVVFLNDPTAHAEVIAIRNACAALKAFQLRGCHIYTSCEPCPMCLTAIYWAHCDAIFYGNTAADAAATGFDDLSLYEEVARPHEDRKKPISMLLHDEALSSFAAWKAQPIRIDY